MRGAQSYHRRKSATRLFGFARQSHFGVGNFLVLGRESTSSQHYYLLDTLVYFLSSDVVSEYVLVALCCAA